MPKHTVRAFATELKDLARKIVEMGVRAEKQISDAFEALTKRNSELAQRVIAGDDAIDELQREVEREAITTIARRQPMAIDLREVVGALRVSNDLERIADLAENIAKRVLILSAALQVEQGLPQLARMVELVRAQLSQVLQSYVHRDSGEALEVWRRDQEIDAMHESLFRELLTYMMEDGRKITFCTHLLFCAKNVERMGDHVTNVAETVYYIVEGRALTQQRPKADITSVGDARHDPTGHQGAA